MFAIDHIGYICSQLHAVMKFQSCFFILSDFAFNCEPLCFYCCTSILGSQSLSSENYHFFSCYRF